MHQLAIKYQPNLADISNDFSGMRGIKQATLVHCYALQLNPNLKKGSDIE